MNPLVKKEIRLLLPALLIGCGLGVADVWLYQYQFMGWMSTAPLLACLAMATMVAMSSFGAEVGTGTFTLLLAQPVTRQKIWQTKITLLAVALMIMGFAWFAPEYFWLKFLNPNGGLGHLWDAFEWMLLAFLVIFSGALWTVLLLRQVAAAFWFIVLVPGVIVIISSGFLTGENDSLVEGVLVIVLGLYSLAGLFFARWLFMRAQDSQWSGGAIEMPEIRGTPAWFSRLTAWRLTHPRTALWRKEFQLQQPQFIMAFALAILHLGVVTLRHEEHFRKNSMMELVVESFWLVWLAMPCLVGCAAVAEERKLGTHESQLCLPVKRRTQFAIKLSVVVTLSILLGAVMPLLFEGTQIGEQIRPNLNYHFVNILVAFYGGQQSFPGECFQWMASNWPLISMIGFVIASGLISFFISTQARNTLQALAPAAIGIIFFGFWMAAGHADNEYYRRPLWRCELIYIIGVPVLFLTLLAQSYRNFRQVSPGWKIWSSNLLRVFASLVLTAVLTITIYQRPWDKLTPFEPPHGPARLTLSDAASLSEQGGETFVRLPGGRTWMDDISFSPTLDPLAVELGYFKMDLNDIPIDGFHWKTVRRASRELVGIKDDGTLWVSEKWQQSGELPYSGFQENEKTLSHLVQFGNETNWSNFQSFSPFVILTKTDGTLWRWGPTNYDWRNKPWPELQTFMPECVGTESNWAGFFHSRFYPFLHKTDGSVWVTADYQISNKGIKLGGYLQAYPITGPIRGKVRDTEDVWSPGNGEFTVFLFDSGILRTLVQEKFIPLTGKNESYSKWEGTDIPMDHGSNWVAMASSGASLVTLKDDGTLWSWNFPNDFRSGSMMDYQEIFEHTTPVQLSTHSDWVAVAGGWGNVVSLAADGSLWYWAMKDPRDLSDSGQPVLADYSQKPQLLGNVFSTNSITP